MQTTNPISHTETPPLSTLLKDSGHAFQEGFYELNPSNVEAFIRSNFASEYHPIGTCAMGPESGEGVVDERLRVHGTSNVRVVDASVFPLQVRYGYPFSCISLLPFAVGTSRI